MTEFEQALDENRKLWNSLRSAESEAEMLRRKLGALQGLLFDKKLVPATGCLEECRSVYLHAEQT